MIVVTGKINIEVSLYFVHLQHLVEKIIEYLNSSLYSIHTSPKILKLYGRVKGNNNQDIPEEERDRIYLICWVYFIY